jgi:hypothetical protein
MINGKQHALTWYVDDLQSSHIDPKVNNQFSFWLKTKYANDKIGEIKTICGTKQKS